MTDRSRILALAAACPDGAWRRVRNSADGDALLDAIAVCDDDGDCIGYTLPSGTVTDDTPRSETYAVRAWIAASRRAAANPTRRKGPAVPAGRTRRISARVSDATEAALKGHAERTGRSVATVAGDVLEGWADNVNAPKGDGGSDE